MISCNGVETVKLTKELQLLGKVEVYLQDLINVMISSLKELAGISFKNSATMNRAEWIAKDPS